MNAAPTTGGEGSIRVMTCLTPVTSPSHWESWALLAGVLAAVVLLGLSLAVLLEPSVLDPWLAKSGVVPPGDHPHATTGLGYLHPVGHHGHPR